MNRLLDSITFHKYTENTITDKARLLEEIDIIKKRGYAIDNEEHEKNIACIAAPIRNYTKRVVASVSITAVLYSLEKNKLLKYKDLLLEKSNKISKVLGCFENR